MEEDFTKLSSLSSLLVCSDTHAGDGNNCFPDLIPGNASRFALYVDNYLTTRVNCQNSI